MPSAIGVMAPPFCGQGGCHQKGIQATTYFYQRPMPCWTPEAFACLARVGAWLPHGRASAGTQVQNWTSFGLPPVLRMSAFGGVRVPDQLTANEIRELRAHTRLTGQLRAFNSYTSCPLEPFERLRHYESVPKPSTARVSWSREGPAATDQLAA